MDFEATFGNCITQLVDESQPVAVVVDLVPVGLARRWAYFGAIHGEVRAAQQADAVGCVDRRTGDADAGTYTHGHRVEHEWLFELGDEAVCDRNRVLRRGVHDEHGEFITAHPHEDIGVAQASREAWTQLPEDLVAGGVSE